MVDNRYRPAFDNRVRPAYNRYRPAFDNRVRPAITKQYSDGGRTKTLLSEDPIPESVYREVEMAIDAASRAQPVDTTLHVPVTEELYCRQILTQQCHHHNLQQKLAYKKVAWLDC